jgi:hypothetical protein
MISFSSPFKFFKVKELLEDENDCEDNTWWDDFYQLAESWLFQIFSIYDVKVAVYVLYSA